MDKTALIKEKIDQWSGKVLEQFSDEFRELMDTLREVDTNVRAEYAPLKDLLKVAKTNFNRREYMTAISYLAQFHEKIENMYNEFSKLNKAIDMKHHKFLFDDLDPEHIKYLVNRKINPFDKKAWVVADWWHNLTDDRGRSLAAWEKRFPKYTKEIKKHVSQFINKSEALLSFLKSALKALKTFKDTRKMEDYLNVVSKIKDKFNGYDALFINLYNSQVKRYVEYQQAMLAGYPKGMEQAQQQYAKEQEVSNKPIDNTPLPFPPPSSGERTIKQPIVEEFKPISIENRPAQNDGVSSKPIDNTPLPFPEEPRGPQTVRQSPLPFDQLQTGISTEEGPKTTPQGGVMLPPPPSSNAPFDLVNPKIPKASPVPNIEEEQEEAERIARQEAETFRPQPKSKGASINHGLFLKTISSLQDRHPLIIAKEIIIYARSIKKTDPEISKKLLSMAQRIANG